MEKSNTSTAKLSVKDAAKSYGVSIGLIKKAVYQGHLSARKFGRRVLIDSNDLQTFFDNLPSASAVGRADHAQTVA